MKTYINFISRILIGLVFVFSGFVKCVDPLGTIYKLGDYFTAFHWDWLNSLAFPLALLLCGIELLIGLMLVFNVKTNWAAWMTVIFMGIFTPLTLYLALTNPVHDCGCFGDALILTNWQTFWKNIVLDIFVLVLFINRNRYHEWIGPIGEILLIIVMAGFIGIFQSSNLNNLPLIDFRPYKIGNNIPALMTIPEDAPQDIYESVFYYEKDGVKHRYNSVEDIPADPGKFINRDTRLIQKGYEPPIHDFSIVTRDGADITNDVLHSDGYVFLLIAYDLKKSNPDYFDQINEIARFVINRGNRFIVLTASLDDEIDTFTDLVGADYPFCTTDQITLKTIIRSNPGLVMLKNGTIINKWHYKHLPDLDKLASEIPSFK